jgi:hypothetical protein
MRCGAKCGRQPLYVYTMPHGGQICLMHPSVGGLIGSALIEELIAAMAFARLSQSVAQARSNNN